MKKVIDDGLTRSSHQWNQKSVYEEELRLIQNECFERNVFEKKSNQTTGICFSGGGLRSASFSMGVLQYITNHGFYKDIDYISSVSGGSYTIASFFTFLKRRRGRGNVQKKKSEMDIEMKENLRVEVESGNGGIDDDLKDEKEAVRKSTELFRKNVRFINKNLTTLILNIISVVIANSHNFLFILAITYIVSNILYKDLNHVVDWNIEQISMNRTLQDCSSIGLFSPYYYRIPFCYLRFYSLFDDIRNVNVTDTYYSVVSSYTSSFFFISIFWYFMLGVIVLVPILCTSLYAIQFNCVGYDIPQVFNVCKSGIIHFCCNCCCLYNDEKEDMKSTPLDSIISNSTIKKVSEPVEKGVKKVVEKIDEVIETGCLKGLKKSGHIFMFLLTVIILLLVYSEIFKISLYIFGVVYKVFHLDLFLWIILFGFLAVLFIYTCFSKLLGKLDSFAIFGLFGFIGLVVLFVICLIVARFVLFMVWEVGFFEFLKVNIYSKYFLFALEIASYCFCLVQLIFSKFFHELINNQYRFILLRSFFKEKKDILISKLPYRPLLICNCTLNNYKPPENVNNYRKGRKYHSFFISPIFMGSRVLGFIKFPFRRIQFFLSRAVTISAAAISISAGFYDRSHMNTLNSILFFIFSWNLGRWQNIPINYFFDKFFYYFNMYISIFLLQILPGIVVVIGIVLIIIEMSHIFYMVLIGFACATIILSFIPSILYVLKLKFPSRIRISSDIVRRIFQLFGYSQKQRDDYFFLSDGAHYGDLLGLYQLVHRKVKNILIFDSSSGMLYSTYHNDTLYFVLNELMKEGIIEQTIILEDDQSVLNISELQSKENIIQITKECFFKFSITYCDDGSTSNIWYGKGTITGDHDENMMLHLYSLMHKDFPQESMTSVNLTVEQWDIYMCLGHHVAKKMLNDYLCDDKVDKSPMFKKDVIKNVKEKTEIMRRRKSSLFLRRYKFDLGIPTSIIDEKGNSSVKIQQVELKEKPTRTKEEEEQKEKIKVDEEKK